MLKYRIITKLKLFELFNTSVGIIAILEFPVGKSPFIGLKIHKAQDEIWEVCQIGFHNGTTLSESYKTYMGNGNLWNCNLKELQQNLPLSKNDILFSEEE